jgi:hypothetical protein
LCATLSPTGIQNTATDVTTGQPNPAAIQSSYQSTVTMDANPGIIAPSVPSANNGVGGSMVGMGNPGVGGSIYSSAMPDGQSGFRHQNQQSSQNQVIIHSR